MTTIALEARESPATASPDAGRQEHTITVDGGNKRVAVNATKPGSTHMRMPVELARRIDRLREDMQRAYSEGRVEIPPTLCDRIPSWYVIANALDEQAARRERSRRPRRKQS
jgi:hypothetical protein